MTSRRGVPPPLALSGHAVKPLERSRPSRGALVSLGVLGVVLVAAVGLWFAYPRLMLPSPA